MSNFESCRFAITEDYADFEVLFAQSRQEASTYKASDIWLTLEALEGTPETIFNNYIADNEKAILVGEFNEVPVGFMLLKLFKLGEALAVRVDEVYVHSEVREVGVGERLMNSAIDWGKQNGAVRILGRTFPGDRHMKNFYERFKVTARLIEVSKELN
jgi:GNAT superfamily N-acetyltransferase